jgi:hypothetical protein
MGNEWNHQVALIKTYTICMYNFLKKSLVFLKIRIKFLKVSRYADKNMLKNLNFINVKSSIFRGNLSIFRMDFEDFL